MSLARAIVKTSVVTTALLTMALVLFCLWFGQGQHRTDEGHRANDTKYNIAPDETTVVEQPNTPISQDKRQNNQSNASKWSDPIVILTELLVVGVFITAAIYYG